MNIEQPLYKNFPTNPTEDRTDVVRTVSNKKQLFPLQKKQKNATLLWLLSDQPMKDPGLFLDVG